MTTTDVSVKSPGTHSYSYDEYLYDSCTSNTINNPGWTSPFSVLKSVLSIHFERNGTLTVPSGKIGKITVSKTHTAYGSTGGDENTDANEWIGGEVFSGTVWVAFAWSRNERSYTNADLTTVIIDNPGTGGGG